MPRKRRVPAPRMSLSVRGFVRHRLIGRTFGSRAAKKRTRPFRSPPAPTYPPAGTGARIAAASCSWPRGRSCWRALSAATRNSGSSGPTDEARARRGADSCEAHLALLGALTGDRGRDGAARSAQAQLGLLGQPGFLVKSAEPLRDRRRVAPLGPTPCRSLLTRVLSARCLAPGRRIECRDARLPAVPPLLSQTPLRAHLAHPLPIRKSIQTQRSRFLTARDLVGAHPPLVR